MNFSKTFLIEIPVIRQIKPTITTLGNTLLRRTPINEPVNIRGMETKAK